ncbi:MAG: hypothetical protein J6Q22_13890 [Prevotella sp.]|nr:hypothetical protein [Prevotella sp.]
MKPYIVLKIADKEYQLKITTSAAIELEDKLNTSIVEGLSRLGETRILAKYFLAAARTLNEGVKTENDAYMILDEYSMSGGKYEDLYDVILEVMENSGFIRQEAIDASKKMQAQLQKKQAELLS